MSQDAGHQRRYNRPPSHSSDALMNRFQDIWQKQCEAARRVLALHGSTSALDYLVGEKLMTFVATAEDHPEFARELPKFVAKVREIFGPDALAAYVASLEKIYLEGEAAAREAIAVDNEEDAEVFDQPNEWVTEGRRLARIRDFLTTERLGTA